MATEQERFVEAALKTWQASVDRAAKIFAKFSDEELEREVAPGRNRLIYLYGHLLAVSDAMYATLRLGERMHPEMDEPFLKSADRAAELLSARDVRASWAEVHERLAVEMAKLTPEQWLERHASVSKDDFVKEPHRNRYALLLSRTGHMAFHVGQLVLVK